MRDRAIFRLAAVKYLNEFKGMIKEYRDIINLGQPVNSEQLKEIIKNIEELVKNDKSEDKAKKSKELSIYKSIENIGLIDFEEIELPANFEYIYQSSIKVKTKIEDSSVKYYYEIDYIRIKNMLQFAYMNDYFENITDNENEERFHKAGASKLSEYVLKDMKNTLRIVGDSKKRDPIEDKIRLICLLFEFSFNIVEEYFPLNLYGFPSLTLIIWLMNEIIGNEVTIEEINPYVLMNNDVYNLKLKLENDYFKKILRDNNIDYNKIIDNDVQYYNDYEMLDKIINMNPSCSIVINPYFRVNQINKSYDLICKINNSVDKLKELYVYNDIALANEYSKVVRYSEYYVDRRFNRKMSNKKIIDDLSKNQDRGLSDPRVSVEIKELCAATGLVDPLSKAKK